MRKLTPTERKVFELMIEGDSCKEIAFKLGISRRTVEDHRREARIKTNARNNNHMIAILLRSMQ